MALFNGSLNTLGFFTHPVANKGEYDDQYKHSLLQDVFGYTIKQ